MRRKADARILLWVLVALYSDTALAQTTPATLFGTIVDVQGHVVPGATLVLRSLDTGQARTASTDHDGQFRLIGLLPGPHEFHAELAGFEPFAAAVALVSGEGTRLDVTLGPASLRETVSVTGEESVLDTARLPLGRTTSRIEIDSLPVSDRGFLHLASLTPGVLPNQAANVLTSSAIVTAGQTGRSNTMLLDGLSLDGTFLASLRGGLPIDAARDFVVMTNGFTAEYGQASGALVSVSTRSGTNAVAGRASYFHRDARWDAPPATARLVAQARPAPPFEQKMPGITIGGPIRTNRAFYFGSLQETIVDTSYVAATPLLATFRPEAPASVPLRTRRFQLFARGDMNLGGDSALVRYRLDRLSSPGTFLSQNSGKSTPENRYDASRLDQDLGGLHTSIWGGRGFNELRLQFSQRSVRSDLDGYCVRPCPGFYEDRPGIKLGSINVYPSQGGQTWVQMGDHASMVGSGPRGEHVVSAGIDLTVSRGRFRGAANRLGTFTFRTDAPFDAANSRTYPVFYTQTIGDSDARVPQMLVALFAQDRWLPRSDVTVHLGVRWDYDSLTGVFRDRNNIAPRIGVAFNLDRHRRIVLRANYGIYYDQMLVAIVNDYEQAQQAEQIQVSSPGYPNWRDPSPNRPGPLVVGDNTRRLSDLQTPYTEQATGGVQRSFNGLNISMDWVWARGRNLFETHDTNAPDANGRRPDPQYQFVRRVESRGRSSYHALQVGMTKRLGGGRSASLAYTLSQSRRDTEDYDFTPQNQNDFSAELAPGTSDVRHQLVTSGSTSLPWGFVGSLVLTARTAAPYNVTTGTDNNRDGTLNDRPTGYSRNSARGATFVQLDARMMKQFRTKRLRCDLIVEGFNLANRANWTAYDGVQASETFGRPLSAAIARQIQVGVRTEF